MSYLIGLVVALFGYGLFQRGRAKSAEALNENIETKEQVQKLEGQRLENTAALTLEEQRRKDAHENAEKDKSAIDPDIADFFNKLK